MVEAYITAATRTVGSRCGGRLSGWHATDLPAEAFNEIVDKAGADPKLMTTLVHALHEGDGRYGLKTMCEGGGMASVIIIKRL